MTCLAFFVLAILYEVLKAYRRVVALRFQLAQTARIVNRVAAVAAGVTLGSSSDAAMAAAELDDGSARLFGGLIAAAFGARLS